MYQLFYRCVEKILDNEGGYSNNPNDPGGETNFGISKRSYPNLDIRNLTREKAREIYLNDFYKHFKLDYLKNHELTLQVFDMVVNSGDRGIKILQKLIAAVPDGIIGLRTLEKLNREILSGRDLVTAYKLGRIEYYTKLAQNKKAYRSFFLGWVVRVFKTKL